MGGHDGAYKGRVHVIVPFVERKNGNLIDHQQSYNVLVHRVPGLEEGVMFGGKAFGIDGRNIDLDAGRVPSQYHQAMDWWVCVNPPGGPHGGLVAGRSAQ